jgi:hypothetical protein
VRPLYSYRRPFRRIAATAVLALAAIQVAPYAAATELPELRHGTWELRGVSDGRVVDRKKCTSPGRDIAEESAVLSQAGCRVSSVERSGNRYTFQTDCRMKTRSGRRLTLHRTSVLTVDGDATFRLRVRGTTNGRPIAETVTGTRIGDCDR